MDDRERYRAAGHRVQTAIAAMPDHPNQTPKHLRVGIDLSKSDAAGLAQLLIEKGIFTEEEFLRAIADSAETEANAYEREVSERLEASVRTI